MQHVRRALLVECGPLAHAEAVLLVDDRHRQRAKAHIRLDQRVRADHERELAAREPAQHLAPPAGARGAGEERSAHGLGAHQALDRGEVLFGQRLRGSHQRGLTAVLDGAQHRVQRDHRLAASDLAHQEALHGVRGLQVRGDVRDRAPLIAGQREREPVLEPALGERRLLGERRRARACLPARAAAQQQ